MRISYVVAVAASLLAGQALAQYNAPSNPPASNAQAPKAEKAPAAPSAAPAAPRASAPAAEGPQNPAIRTQEGNTAARPVAGANSFTEGEAKSRIEARGFVNVTGLMKDDQGLWRGRAQQNGRNVTVALDYQGNVFGDPS